MVLCHRNMCRQYLTSKNNYRFCTRQTKNLPSPIQIYHTLHYYQHGLEVTNFMMNLYKNVFQIIMSYKHHISQWYLVLYNVECRTMCCAVHWFLGKVCPPELRSGILNCTILHASHFNFHLFCVSSKQPQAV